MATDRRHFAVSADGTEIVGEVTGEGPPLVLVHGSLEDGRTCWQAMLPFLEQRFTCYRPSTRRRGLSGETTDLSPQRRLEDVVAFVDSIEQQVCLFGESDGGALALGAAAVTDVQAVAAYEPTVFEVADDHLQASLDATVPDVVQAVERNDLTAAVAVFMRMLANDDELAALSATGYLDEASQYMPVFLDELEQHAASDAPGPTDPSRITKISVPTLLMQGTMSKLHDWFARGARYVAEHVRDPHIEAIPDAGHFGVALRPEPIAEQLTRFFTQVPAAN